MAKRLSKDEWATARVMWESDQSATDTSVAGVFGVSKQAVEQQRKKNGWSRYLTYEQILKQEYDSHESVERRIKAYQDHKKLERQTRKQIRKEIANGKDRSGYIYLMRVSVGCDVWYKIGRATNVSERLIVVQTGSPFPIVLLNHWEVSQVKKTEKMMHSLFSDKRGIGEWFSLSDLDIEKLYEMMRCLD